MNFGDEITIKAIFKGYGSPSDECICIDSGFNDGINSIDVMVHKSLIVQEKEKEPSTKEDK